MNSKILSFLWHRKYIFLFLGLFALLLTQRFNSKKQNGLANTVSLNGVGYYAYLPAAIIYNDFTYSFFVKKDNYIQPQYRPIFNSYKDKRYNKYFCGTSICLLPFFLVGVVISAIAGTDMNGYTDTFFMLISLAALIYFLLSVFFITKIGKFFSIPEKTSFFACLVFFFATNLCHYVIQECTMSHLYSFFAISLFFYLYTRLYENISSKNFIFLGLSMGLIFLVRPTNMLIVLFIPFFSENLKEFWAFVGLVLSKNSKGLLICVAVLFSVMFLQFWFYYLQTGAFFIPSYDGESFNFSKPEIINVLISYRKGLFIYTPLLLAGITFIIFSKSYWYKKMVFFATFFVFLFVAASWYCWWYGGSFGNRAFIDIYPVFIIVLIYMYNKILLSGKRLLMILTVPFIFLNQVMAWQYSGLIIDSSNMNKEKFWDMFLMTDLAKINKVKTERLLRNNKPYKIELLTYENDSEWTKDGGFESNKASIVNNDHQFSKGFEFQLQDIPYRDNYYIIAECVAKSDFAGRELALVVCVWNGQNCLKWDAAFKRVFKSDENGWTKISLISEIDRSLIIPGAKVKISATNNLGESLVDDLKYTIVAK